MKVSQNRALALDALRGYAIITMVLSATEVFSILPGWMYHAQVPPPDHVFDPTRYGITWVDLIFPFFLFSMGAAIPLSLGRLSQKGTPMEQLLKKVLYRWFRLTFFALFVAHAYPYMLGYPQEWMNYAVPIGLFLLLCLMFIPNPFGLSDGAARCIRWSAYAVGTLIVVVQPYTAGHFQLKDVDVIMLILANVSLTGMLIYLLTQHHPRVRWAIMLLLMLVYGWAEVPESVMSDVMKFNPLPWLFNVAYQEYLILLIPGMAAGELLTKWLKDRSEVRVACSKGQELSPSSDSTTLNLSEGKPTTETFNPSESGKAFGSPRAKAPAWVALVALLVIVLNVALLYDRALLLNFCITVCLLPIIGWLLRGSSVDETFWRHLYQMGALLLVAGLLLEPIEGGIRKDYVNLCYLLTTGGLAYLSLLVLSVACDYYRLPALSKPLEMVGRNPMVAYVACSMVVIPVLWLLKVYPLIVAMEQIPLTGFLKGVLLTAITVLLTCGFTAKKWYWKT
jgi:predicted acyltransferase